MLLERYLTSFLSHLPEPETTMVRDWEALVRLAGLTRLVCTSGSVFYEGPPAMRNYFAVQDQKWETRQKILQVAGSFAATLDDPYAEAISRATVEANLPLREIETDPLGSGVIGKLEKTWYIFGDETVMTAEAIGLGVTGQALALQLESGGKQMYFLAQKQPKRLLGIFACDRVMRPGAAEFVSGLQGRGIEVSLLTNQKTRVAKALTDQLGIVIVNSELKGGEKQNILRSLVKKDPDLGVLAVPKTLPELTKGGLRILVAPHTEARADITIAQPESLLELIDFSRAALQKAKRRYFWAKI